MPGCLGVTWIEWMGHLTGTPEIATKPHDSFFSLSHHPASLKRFSEHSAKEVNGGIKTKCQISITTPWFLLLLLIVFIYDLFVCLCIYLF